MTIRINIGCGQNPTNGWQNFDNTPSIKLARSPIKTLLLKTFGLLNKAQLENIEWNKIHNIKFTDATKNIPFENSSVDIVNTSHMLEHLSRNGAKKFLYESLRILKNDGVLRISVPDLSKYIDKYLLDKDANAFMSNTYISAPSLETFKEKLRLIFVGYRHHQWMYDGASLSKLLLEVGFKKAIIQESGKTCIDDLGELNLYKKHGQSVYVEAIK